MAGVVLKVFTGWPGFHHDFEQSEDSSDEKQEGLSNKLEQRVETETGQLEERGGSRGPRLGNRRRER